MNAVLCGLCRKRGSTYLYKHFYAAVISMYDSDESDGRCTALWERQRK